jgi:hypothetical protein
LPVLRVTCKKFGTGTKSTRPTRQNAKNQLQPQINLNQIKSQNSTSPIQPNANIFHSTNGRNKRVDDFLLALHKLRTRMLTISAYMIHEIASLARYHKVPHDGSVHGGFHSQQHRQASRVARQQSPIRLHSLCYSTLSAVGRRWEALNYHCASLLYIVLETRDWRNQRLAGGRHRHLQGRPERNM